MRRLPSIKGTGWIIRLFPKHYLVFSVAINTLHGQITYIKDQPLGILIIEVIGNKSEVDPAIEFIAKRTKQLEVLVDVADLINEFGKALLETSWMMSVACYFCVIIIWIPLGIALFVTSEGMLDANRIIHRLQERSLGLFVRFLLLSCWLFGFH